MAQQKQSFLEKNFPSLFKNKKSKSLTGKKVRSISETTREAKAIRNREEKSKIEGIEVKEVSELKGYKPTSIKLPTADLLPIESKIRIKKRHIRFLTFIGIMLVVAATILARTFLGLQSSDDRSAFEESQKAVAAQQAVNAKYGPLQSYIQQIQARNSASQAVNKLLPPFPQVLNGMEASVAASGVTLSTYNLTSKDEAVPGGDSSSGGSSGQAGSGSGLQGACGPLNNPYDSNTAPVIGCLDMTVQGDSSQALALENSLKQLPYLAEVNVAQSSDSSSSSSSSATPSAQVYRVTASIITDTSVSETQTDLTDDAGIITGDPNSPLPPDDPALQGGAVQ